MTAGSRARERAGRHRARRGEGELLREEILDAAERLLLREGSTTAVSVRAIAREVGVTPPSLYLHFPDKDHLFFAVCARRFEEFGAAMRTAAAGADDPAAQVVALGRAYIRYALEHPEHYRVMFGAHTILDSVEVPDRAELPGMQALQVLVDVVARGVAVGVFRPVDPVAAAVALWAAVHGAVSVALLARDDHFLDHLDLGAAHDTVLDVCVRGLLAEPGSRRR